MQKVRLIALSLVLSFTGLIAQIPQKQTEPVQKKLRVFITDSDSWTSSGGFGGSGNVVLGGGSGGARPQTAEIIKTFNERCPELTVTSRQEKASYIILLDHEGGKPIFLRDNKIVVFNHEGDVIHSGSTRSLGNAVKDACYVIRKTEFP